MNRTQTQRMEGAVWGLIETAAAKARDSADSKEDIDKLRDIVSELVDYWGLDLHFIDQFDIEVAGARPDEAQLICGILYNQECVDDLENRLQDFQDEDDPNHRIRSSSEGDYSPGNPWDAPGMSIRDFIR